MMNDRSFYLSPNLVETGRFVIKDNYLFNIKHQTQLYKTCAHISRLWIIIGTYFKILNDQYEQGW